MVDDRTIAVYDARAVDYARLNASDKPDAHLQDFIDLMPKGAHVLDLGCGPAAASAHMRNASLVPHPIDASQGMVQLANDSYNIDAVLGTFDDIRGTAIYDGIWANFSLLHAPRADLPRHVAALVEALKTGGTIHVALKSGEGVKRDAIDRLYTFLTVQELQNLLTDAGLRVNYTAEGMDKALAGTDDPWVLCRAIKDA